MTESPLIRTNADTLAAATNALAHEIAGAQYTIHDGRTPAYILGNITSALDDLHQILAQLSAWHTVHSAGAMDNNGTTTTGAIQAIRTATELANAAQLINQVTGELMKAHSGTNQIIWNLLEQRSA